MQIPRVELQEMGPCMDLSLRRLRPAGTDMEHEAFARVKPAKKKVCTPGTPLHCVSLPGHCSALVLNQSSSTPRLSIDSGRSMKVIVQ